jgi:hypothetical protein
MGMRCCRLADRRHAKPSNECLVSGVNRTNVWTDRVLQARFAGIPAALMSNGPNIPTLIRHAVDYAYKIFSTRPAWGVVS